MAEPKLHENFRIQVIVSRKLKDDGKVDFAIAAGPKFFRKPIWEGKKVDTVKFATGMVKIPLAKGGEAFSNYMGLWPRNDDVVSGEKGRRLLRLLGKQGTG